MGEDIQRLELTQRADRLEREVLLKWSAFVEEQPVHARTFLVDQARLTSIEQPDATRAIEGGIPALREELSSVLDLIDESMKAFFRAVDNEAVLRGWNVSTPSAEAKADDIVRPFADALMDLGYDPGSKSKHPGIARDWYYYRPSRFHTELQRQGKGMPLSPKLTDYTEAAKKLAILRGELATYDAQAKRAAIAAEWDSL